MALLTEIHYLFIQSPLDIEGECSQTAGLATVKSYWCGFSWAIRGRRWRYLPPDSWWFSWPESGVVGVVFDFVLPLNSTFTPALAFSFCLSLPVVSHRHFLPLSSPLPQTYRGVHLVCVQAAVVWSPALPVGLQTLLLFACIGRECVTCICPGSLEGVRFCSQSCKQGGALFPNRSVGDGYFHRSFFFCWSFWSIDYPGMELCVETNSVAHVLTAETLCHRCFCAQRSTQLWFSWYLQLC